MTSLAQVLDTPSIPSATELPQLPPGSEGSGDSGTARGGLSQVNKGAGEIGGALGRIENAVGSAGQGDVSKSFAQKKGGSIKKYAKGGAINLKDCSISTATKNKLSPNW